MDELTNIPMYFPPPSRKNTLTQALSLYVWLLCAGFGLLYGWINDYGRSVNFHVWERRSPFGPRSPFK